MQPITYSSSEHSQLNTARRSLWVAKYMLGQCNNENFSRSFWMGRVNTYRAELRTLARAIRAKLPAQDVYRVQLSGESTTFAQYEYAHSQAQAERRVMARYNGGFHVQRNH